METEKKSSRPYRGISRTPYTEKLFVYVSKSNDIWVRRNARNKGLSLSRLVDELITRVRRDDLTKGSIEGLSGKPI